jgi:hypothetical protein
LEHEDIRPPNSGASTRRWWTRGAICEPEFIEFKNLEKVKEIYFYLFYKMFKFWEVASVPKFLSEVKAIICLIALEELLVATVLAYYAVFIDNSSNLLREKWIYFLFGALIIFPNCFIFLYQDRWKLIVAHHGKFNVERRNKGGLLVGSAILVIVLNFFISFYLYLKLPTF